MDLTRTRGRRHSLGAATEPHATQPRSDRRPTSPFPRTLGRFRTPSRPDRPDESWSQREKQREELTVRTAGAGDELAFGGDGRLLVPERGPSDQVERAGVRLPLGLRVKRARVGQRRVLAARRSGNDVCGGVGSRKACWTVLCGLLSTCPTCLLLLRLLSTLDLAVAWR